MNTEKKDVTGSQTEKRAITRRNFVRGAATVAAVAAAVPLEPMLGGEGSVAEAAVASYQSNERAEDSYKYRTGMAKAEKITVHVQADNGDLARYSDLSGIYSKGLLHDALGIPNAAAAQSLISAFASGEHEDFANIIVGTPGGGPNSRLNGPQLALAFDLEGLDSHATVIPPAPTVASAQTAAEAVEHYWAALLADVNFIDYGTDPLVGQAVADLNNLSFLQSPANKEFPYPVTRQNLFRGRFVTGDGNVQGPYVSQLMLQPTFYGAQPLDQRYRTFQSISGGGSDYMTFVGEYQLVQNGGDSGRTVVFDPTTRYVRNGRDLAAYTRVDVLYQGYFTAFLVLAGLGAVPNPGNPYIGSLTEKAFATLGGPDAAGTLAEMATRALKASWFHKWIVNLRLRPEEYGALVHAR